MGAHRPGDVGLEGAASPVGHHAKARRRYLEGHRHARHGLPDLVADDHDQGARRRREGIVVQVDRVAQGDQLHGGGRADEAQLAGGGRRPGAGLQAHRPRRGIEPGEGAAEAVGRHGDRLALLAAAAQAALVRRQRDGRAGHDLAGQIARPQHHFVRLFGGQRIGRRRVEAQAHGLADEAHGDAAGGSERGGGDRGAADAAVPDQHHRGDRGAVAAGSHWQHDPSGAGGAAERAAGGGEGDGFAGGAEIGEGDADADAAAVGRPLGGRGGEAVDAHGAGLRPRRRRGEQERQKGDDGQRKDRRRSGEGAAEATGGHAARLGSHRSCLPRSGRRCAADPCRGRYNRRAGVLASQ